MVYNIIYDAAPIIYKLGGPLWSPDHLGKNGDTIGAHPSRRGLPYISSTVQATDTYKGLFESP